MARRLLLVVAFSMACGGGAADFSGHWVGSLRDTGSCSNGSTVNESEADDWIATQSGSSISFAGNSSCGVLSAAVDGDVAILQPKTCAPVTDGSLTATESITGGTVRISGTTLTVSANVTTAISGSQSGDCTGTVAGTMAKQ